MNKKVYIILGIVFILLLGLILWFFGFNYDPSKDAQEFKNSYESYNGKTSEDGVNYLSVNIEKNNKIEYINVDEAIDKLSKGTSLIFMGDPTDPITRAYVETVINTVDCSCIDKLFYLEVSYKDQNTYSKLVKAIGEETLLLPRIDAVLNGEVVSVIENIGIEDDQNIYDGLNSDQKKELENAINTAIKSITKKEEKTVCDETC